MSAVPLHRHPSAAPRRAARARVALAGLTTGLLLVSGCGAGDDAAPAASPPAPPPAPAASAPAATPTSAAPSPSASATPDAPPGPAALELPRGGRTVFPRYRLVGYAGLTGSPTLGRLGTGPLSARVSELEDRAAPYAVRRQVLPVLEIIATIVRADPGPDGRYRVRSTDATIARYLEVARAHHALLLLNIQPGRADLLREVTAYDRWLAEPDVGLALDPEWAMGPHQVPGRAFGHTTGAVLDEVVRHVGRVVAEHDLPEKVVVYHELAPGIVTDEGELHRRAGVALVKSVDGIGSRSQKESTYRGVNAATPGFVHPGFKIFYDEDARSGAVMTPKQVLKLHPVPDYVMYE